MKMASLVILITPALVLIGTAVAVVTAAGKAGMANPGAHGFSEVLYAFSSAGNNNGSAFAGLSANTPFYNMALGSRCCSGGSGSRFPCWPSPARWPGRRSSRRVRARCPTHTPLFVVLLVGVVILVGALTFVPALALGRSSSTSSDRRQVKE